MLYYEKRVCVMYSVIVAFAILLCARLYNLSQPDTNRSMQVLDGQYTGRITVCSRSGFVYDRNGNVISHSVAGRTALVNPAECEDVLLYSEKLSAVSLVSDASDIYEKLLEGVPFTLSVSYDAQTDGLEGVYIFDIYEEDTDFAKHFLGYNNVDGVGMSGLRKAYGQLLGQELKSTVSASFDTNAKRVSLSPFIMNTQKYLSYDGVVTTLDKNLQNFCDGLGSEIQSGAVVVTDVDSGKILASSSFPVYDADNIVEYLDSDKGELVNRVTTSFTPGSVFKIVVAAAALENDENLFDYKYTCTGEIKVGKDTFRCHKHSGHGEISMEKAFAHSCNTYFINLGQIIGLSEIIKTAKKLELDECVGADFLRENTNFFIDENSESIGYLANISFGQGELCLSPLDMTRIIIAASTGELVTLSAVLGEMREEEFVKNEKGKSQRIFCENTCKKMRQMMKSCIDEGTGGAAAVYGVNTGGKTATAQTGRFSQDGVEYLRKWFCGVYPIENPRISVCVLLDDVIDENVSPSVIFGKICSFLLENGL